MRVRIEVEMQVEAGGEARVSAGATLGAKMRQSAQVFICIIFSKYNVFSVSNKNIENHA
jgi:hypothetical protein